MILVTGGLGMIGAHTARALTNLGQEVIVTSHHRAEVPSFLAGQVTVESLDVTDRDAFLTLADRHDISDIVHLAGGIPGKDPVSFFPHGDGRPAQRAGRRPHLERAQVRRRQQPRRLRRPVRVSSGPAGHQPRVRVRPAGNHSRPAVRPVPGRQDGPGSNPYLDITRLTRDTGFTLAFDVAEAVADYVM
jgi:nucleoside-diphosphate-sugar epimerase